MVATGVPGRKKTMPPRHLREAVVPGGQFRSRPRSIAICTLKYQRPRASLSKARCLEVVVAWPSGVAPLRLPLGRGALVPGVVCRTGHAAQELGARLVLAPIAVCENPCPWAYWPEDNMRHPHQQTRCFSPSRSFGLHHEISPQSSPRSVTTSARNRKSAVARTITFTCWCSIDRRSLFPNSSTALRVCRAGC